MTATASIDLSGWLKDRRGQASPDLLRAVAVAGRGRRGTLRVTARRSGHQVVADTGRDSRGAQGVRRAPRRGHDPSAMTRREVRTP